MSSGLRPGSRPASSARVTAAPTAQGLASLPLPPHTPLAGIEPGSFANDTITRRLPSILANAQVDLHAFAQSVPEGTALRSDAAAASAEIGVMAADMPANNPLTVLEVPVSAPPHLVAITQVTNACVEAWEQKVGKRTWLDLPWLVIECYMYVRLALILQQYDSLKGRDVFQEQKQSAFVKSQASVQDIAADVRKLLLEGAAGPLETQEQQFLQVLQYSLWGNKTDLSLLVDVSQVDAASLATQLGGAGAPALVADDSQRVWQLLSGSEWRARPRRVDIVLDNAGLELYSDLCLADWLVNSGAAARVVLHGKLLPWFVSDVNRQDLDFMLDSCAGAAHKDVAWLGQRWRSYLDSGAWEYRAHEAWTTPCPFWWLPALEPELTGELHANSSLVVMKGDLNYRKLAADCRWPLTSTFTAMIGPLAVLPVCALRTLKADLASGLRPGQDAQLDAVDKDWMVNGKFGMVQLSLP